MKILLIEDNSADVRYVRELLREAPSRDVQMEAVTRLSSALDRLREETFDVALVDLGLPDAQGLESLTVIQGAHQSLPLVVLTGISDEGFAAEVVRAGAQDFLTKGRFNSELLMRAIRYAIERKAHERQIEQLNRVYSALYHMNQGIIRASTRQDVFSVTCRVLVEFGRFRMAWIGWHDPETQLLAPVAHYGDDLGYLGRIRVYGDDRPEGRGPAGMAFRKGRTFVCNNVRNVSCLAPWEEAIRHVGVMAVISVPIRMGADVVGVLVVYSTEEDFFREKEVGLLEEAGENVSYAIENLQREVLRKNAELRIREQAELLDKASEAIVIADLNQRVTFWNHGAELLFGATADEMLGRPLEEAFAGVGAGADFQKIDAESDWRGEINGQNRNGDPLVIEASLTTIRDSSGFPTARLAISSDITEQKRLEEQFLRAQRMESLGMLAAGIAHDLNNVLAPIRLVSPLLGPEVAEADRSAVLDILEKSAARGSELVQQIVRFAHGAGGESRLIDVRHLLHDIIRIIQATFPKSIVLEQSIPRSLWQVKANPTHIHQLLLNLCVNARDAMGAGVLRICAENCSLDEETAKKVAGARAGSWLVLHVEDTGTGISPEILPRIWQPFFTTKQLDHGTGLGLSTVRSIVDAHHGFVTVESEVGRGTTFRVFLPAADSISAEQDLDSDWPASGSGELILLVDDEKSIRDIARNILTRNGYRVLTAFDGIDARATFLQRFHEINLVITDIDMPNMDGYALGQAVRDICPETKILATSGLTGGKIETGAGSFATALLKKPFTADRLLSAVAEALTNKEENTANGMAEAPERFEQPVAN